MDHSSETQRWNAGTAPVAVIMISLNEAHNMEAVLQNLRGWAQQVFLVDSYSADDTVDIALGHGVHVVQRKFRGFGDQWNYALNNLPIAAPWTMKLDPDERMTDELKSSIERRIQAGDSTAISLERRLWFMGRPLPIKQEILRLWRTGTCRFSDVTVNEHPIAEGTTTRVEGFLEHHDSPNLQHWLEKQNRYSTAEALNLLKRAPLSAQPDLFGDSLARRMWLKQHFLKVPFRHPLLYLLNLYRVKPWESGYEGLAWARLRVWVHRFREDKLREMKTSRQELQLSKPMTGKPHVRAIQADDGDEQVNDSPMRQHTATRE